jgi:vacuolar-type H+-ATPase subunit I/STV1
MRTRIIHTRIWEDSFFSDLKPKDKLLFLYLLSNDRVNLIGVYELPVKYISVDTGLTENEIQEGLSQLSEKILYFDNYVCIKNHKKYQNYSQGNKNQRKSYNKEIEDLPENLKDLYQKDFLTSSQLVDNQLTSSQQLDINYNTKIINQKSEIINRKKQQKNKKEITQQDKQEISVMYGVPFEFVESKFEDLINYIESTGKRYKDYKATLRNWVKRDRDKIKLQTIVNKPVTVKIV